MAVGAILFMHEDTTWLLILGALMVLLTMFLWWRDVVREAEYGGHHTPVVSLGHRYGIALFIASEVMFFAAFFWAFFDASLSPTRWSSTCAWSIPAACGRRPGGRCSTPSTCRS